jgi:cytochrome c oxidase cbb3-type subunit III
VSAGLLGRNLGCQAFLAFFAVFLLANSAAARPDQASKPFIRGAIVYKAYCVVCHGEVGDGIARATKLYSADQLRIKNNLSDEDLHQIIRLGGAAVGRSPYMPPWQDELSEEQTNDVVAYLSVVGQQESRGKVVYQTNCILCHGSDHDGNGRAAVLYDPKPSNLVASDKPYAYKMSIITMGSEAMGRSSVMPPWGLQLSEREIEDVTYYLETIQVRR